MIIDREACRDLDLYQLLEGDEGTPEYQSTLLHVDNCPSCQRRLEQMAAESLVWQEAKSVLTAGDNVESRGSQDGNGPVGGPRSPVAWSESMACRLLAPASHPEMLGRVGRYDVERLIGSGGMGLVFKAYDTELNRPVAVKLLAPYLAGIGSARKRFSREARAAAAIVDEHVVAIHNVESSDDPSEAPFLVMKYIAGGSLQQRIDRDGPLEVCEILRVGIHTAKGLAAAHAQGLIHRDVKPSNILLDEGVERALLTDFGLARTEDDACLTRSGFHPGTPHYMSPEQVCGESIDLRSDLFGLGCVIYAMCTGHPPFRAETSFAVMRRITDDVARPIREINPEIPVWLERIVMKLLSKTRENRFDTADRVAVLLEACLAHLQQPTHVPLPSEVRNQTEKRNRFASWGTGVMVFLCLALFVFAATWVVQELDKGTLRIECALDEVPIRLLHENKEVKQLMLSQSGTTLRVAAGDYTVEVGDEIFGVHVDLEIVSVRSGETQVVQIKKETKEAKESLDQGSEVTHDEVIRDGPVVLPIAYPPPPLHSYDPWSAILIPESPDERELRVLRSEHAKISQAYQEGCEKAKDEVELNRVYEEMDPRELMPSKYLAFEAKYRGTYAGLEALKIVSNLATSGGGVNAAKGRTEATNRLIDHYVEFEGLEPMVDGLGGGVQAARTEEFLNALIERSPQLETRAAALIRLIKNDKVFLTYETQIPAVREMVKQYQKAATPVFRDELASYLQRLETTDFKKLRKDVNRRLGKLADYANTKVRMYGTAAEAAKNLSYAINRVVVGQAAPELIATDINGEAFQLSELRGKIVVLMFSHDNNYQERHASIRQLVARYRQAPVRVVGVMGTNNTESLKAACERGELNWTVLPEPINGPLINGPLSRDWGIEGYPSVFIIGADGTLHPEMHMSNYGAGGYDTMEVRKKLDELLKELYENKAAADEK